MKNKDWEISKGCLQSQVQLNVCVQPFSLGFGSNPVSATENGKHATDHNRGAYLGFPQKTGPPSTSDAGGQSTAGNSNFGETMNFLKMPGLPVGQNMVGIRNML